MINCAGKVVYPTPCHRYGLLAIGEAPGRDEEIAGEGFVGSAGKTLDRLLLKQGISRNDYGRANVYFCRPPNNRKPTATEIDSALPYLIQFLEEVRPKVVLTIGATPTNVFCGKGSLYSKIASGRKEHNWQASKYLDDAHPLLKPALKYIDYIIPSPHTSPLAFHRNNPDGIKWGTVAAEQIELAVNLLNSVSI